MIRAAAAAVGTSLIFLAGCSGASEPEPAASEPAASPVPTDPRDDFAESPEGEAYLDSMESVDPGLRANRAIGWGESLCGDFEAGTVEPSDSFDRIRLRFAGGDRPELTDDQAGVILEAVTRDICPEFAE